MSWGAIKLRYRDSKNVFFDGEASPAPGGGSPAKQEFGSGVGATAIGDGGFIALPLQHNGGDVLLDYTDPANPTFIDSGTYAVVASVVIADGPQAAGAIGVSLGAFATGALNMAPANVSAAWGAPTVGAAAIGNALAGDALTISGINAAGSVGDLNFGVSAFAVVKLA